MLATARNLTLALAVVALTACSSGGDDGGDAANDAANDGATTEQTSADGGTADGGTVTLSDFEIDAPASVAPGTTLTVVNEGDAPHTFTAQSGGEFDTGTLDPGAEGEVTVDGSGEVSYVCTLHPDRMTGTLEVTEG